ncbi:MAG TPA: alpha/beta hydrolase [Cyclobacteriaceae bacterium]|nr:alpha/beta hydrolase [Cyclobacteriaceae bacterium]HMV08013.1 alpha/beta hydrolase [Cyclobacteriaceae bacterium]HMX00653.1 alpha/beta hydrolase [Cyclobacteriaceae bacterium]HMX49472.1 alpha/beta hydrolase [Cyclobacteriaceae bacterium]HMY93456.1 alpha/beta hydrolase [Cyclobacteriaceae bacterium]
MTHSVLLIHGALGSASQLEPVKIALQNSGLAVHSMDLSGHGGAAFQTQFGIEQFASDVLKWLDQNSLRTVNVFGYSMGGYVSLEFASKYPKRVGSIVTLGTKFDWSVESAAREVRKLNPEKILEKVPAFARILEKRHAPNDWKELIQKTSAMMISLGGKPLLTPEVLGAIVNPTWICLGDQDDMADRQYSEDVAGFLPNGKFLLLENTPHPIEKVSIGKLIDIAAQAFH